MKAGSKPSMRARPGGGLSQGLGQFGEHLGEAALAQAGQQKALTQAAADPAQAAAAAQGAKNKQATQAGGPGSMGSSRPPREVGSIKDELITRPLEGIWAEIKSFFSLNTWLGINPETKDPEEKQKRIAIHKRWQQLNQEQQALAKKNYQEELKKKQLEEEEKERKKQAEEQQKDQQIQMPASPQKGPVGPGSGSKKKQASQLLQQQRQTLGQVGGSN